MNYLVGILIVIGCVLVAVKIIKKVKGKKKK